MSADEMCGDYPAPCNCDDPETHDGAVTAAGRPTVPRVGDTITSTEQLDALPDKAVVLDEHVEPWQKLGEGLWCGSAGGPMSGSALLRTRTDEVTVLYVPDEQPCRHCGSCDGPPSCPDCDHAGRPSDAAAIRADIAAAISARRTGIRKPTGYDEGWDDALDIAEQIALGELR